MELPPVQKTGLVVVEEQEIYRKLYEALCSSGSPVRLLACLAYSGSVPISSRTDADTAEVVVVGVNHVTRELLGELGRLQEDSPDYGIVLIASYLTSGIIAAFNKFVATRKSHFGFLFRKSLNHTEQFFEIISAVKSGRVVIDPAFAVPNFKNPVTGSSIAELTPREIAVLNLIARGCTNEAISATLCIDVKTVRHHINNIYGKLKTSAAFDDRHPRVSATNAYHQLTGQLVFEDLG